MSASGSSERDRHLFAPGPKRILALDGGGVRGIVSLAYLERLEHILRARYKRDLLLCEYFDLVGGTSTGSIIATGLALGMEVGDLIRVYLALSRDGFHGSRWHGGIFVPKFRTKPLVNVIRQYVGPETLGSEKLRTGLAIVAKRVDRRSVWVFHNNPKGRFFNSEGTGGIANKDIALADIIRASTAAPTFFAPEKLEVAKGVTGLFVDGGVSPHNNPGLLLFMLATIRGYGINWPVGDDKLMLVAVGTGHRRRSEIAMPGLASPSISLALQALHSVMEDTSWMGQAILQWLGSSPTAAPIDSEIGDLAQDRLGERLFLHYLRYELWLEREWLTQTLKRDVGDAEYKKLCAMDRPELADELLELGRAAAETQIKDEHLPAGFDLAG